MNKILLALIVVQITGGCVQNDRKLISLTPVSNKYPTGEIIEATGDVELKRKGWQSYRVGVVGVGMRLSDGDLLRPAKGAKVIVLCSDGNLWRVPTHVPSGLRNGCIN